MRQIVIGIDYIKAEAIASKRKGIQTLNTTRKELHQSIQSDLKNIISDAGINLDDVKSQTISDDDHFLIVSVYEPKDNRKKV